MDDYPTGSIERIAIERGNAKICDRAMTTRDCPFSHMWENGQAYKRSDHASLPPYARRFIPAKDASPRATKALAY